LKEQPLWSRYENHGAGAATSYHDFSFVTTNRISPGEEIFLPQHPHFYIPEIMPTEDDWVQVGQIITDLALFRDQFPGMTWSVFSDVLRRMKHEIVFKTGMKRIMPDSIEVFDDALQFGIDKALLTEKQRTVEWLEKNGKCLDNLRAGISTIHGAGRGAFAMRHIPKGSIIAPAPLMHIMNISSFKTNANSTNMTEEKSYQLLLNYCFGHRDSSLLLCPTTSVVLINHSRENANAVYRWSSSSSNKKYDKPDPRMSPVENLRSNYSDLFDTNTKLMFDFIATRDIKEGEEIFIDYG